jgi:cytochrome b subunit of formate dehydrogenase
VNATTGGKGTPGARGAFFDHWITAHLVHAGTFVLLLGTGLLLLSPTLRETVTGGYALTARRLHSWGGVAFALVLPPLFVTVFRGRTRGAGRHRGRKEVLWRRGHRLWTVATSVGFVVSGVVLWFPDLLSTAALDWSRDLHRWLTYAGSGVLVIHVCVAAVFTTLESRAAE